MSCSAVGGPTSPSAELRSALLNDRPNRLPAVLALETGDGVPDLIGRSRLDIGDQRRPGDQALRAANCERRLGSDGLAELQQPCSELVGGDDLRHQPAAQRLVRVDEPGLEEEAHGRLVAHQARQ